MLQVTKYPWEEDKHLGKMQTLLLSLLPQYTDQADCQCFLMTEDGNHIQIVMQTA